MSRRRSSVLDVMKEKRRSADATRVAVVDSDPWRLASFGMVDLLKVQMDKKGAAVDAPDARGMTPLLWAATPRRWPTSLDKGASTEVQGYLGMRPLHHACSGSHEAVIDLLLARGAAVDASKGLDEMGNSALHYAAARGVVSIVTKLLDKGADPGLANCQGTTPVMRAAAFAQGGAIKKLAAAGADVARADKDGNTALHIAVRGGHGAIARMLVYMGANIRATNRAGKTAADVALDAATVKVMEEPGYRPSLAQ